MGFKCWREQVFCITCVGRWKRLCNVTATAARSKDECVVTEKGQSSRSSSECTKQQHYDERYYEDEHQQAKIRSESKVIEGLTYFP